MGHLSFSFVGTVRIPGLGFYFQPILMRRRFEVTSQSARGASPFGLQVHDDFTEWALGDVVDAVARAGAGRIEGASLARCLEDILAWLDGPRTPA